MTLVAPTELQHPPFRALGKASSVPERFGADFLSATKAAGTIAIQRKQFPGDFLASVDDGRLAKEVAQMQPIAIRVLVVEGRGTWTTDGQLVSNWGQAWTRDQHRSFLWSMRAAGVWVEWSEDVEDTARVVRGLVGWAKKARHSSLSRRPAARGVWGRPSTREYQLHVIQSLPDVGPELAERILDTLGMPFGWRAGVGVEELKRVHGIGPKKAERIWRCMESAVVPRLEEVG